MITIIIIIQLKILALKNHEKWREFLDNCGETSAVLTDLSKAFDCINVMRTVLKKVCFILSILTIPKGQKKSHLLVYEKRSSLGYLLGPLPVDIYLLKVNNRNTRLKCETCSKLTIKTPERHWRRSSVFIANFEHVIAGWAFVQYLHL